MLHGRCVSVRARRTRVQEIGEFPDVRSGEQFQFRGIEERVFGMAVFGVQQVRHLIGEGHVAHQGRG